jgi:hypothetical protein
LYVLLIRALLNGHNCENSFDIQLLGQEKCLYNYGLLSNLFCKNKIKTGRMKVPLPTILKINL